MPENQNQEAPFLSNIGLMLTYRCTIACPHCIVKAGPLRKEEMRIESALDWISQVRAFRDGYVKGVSLTGGEPFYNLQHLIEIADHAHNLGLIVSVVSNAFWASSKEQALEVLNKCASIGMISISADVHHQKLIPFENVRNAIWAAKKTGKLYDIAVATESEDDPEYLRLLDSILEITDRDYIKTAFILPVGRAEKSSEKTSYELISEPSGFACSMASFPVIFPDGKVIACIGPPITLPAFNPLYLGSLKQESLQAILERAESNYVLHAIRTFGPKELVRLLTEKGYGKLLPGSYIKDATCDVCLKILSDRNLCTIIEKLISDDERFRMKTAYGRYYHLDEDVMLKKDFYNAIV